MLWFVVRYWYGHLSVSITEYTCAGPECFVQLLTFYFRRGERIQIPLKEGHHLPTSKTLLMIGPTLNPGF